MMIGAFTAALVVFAPSSARAQSYTPYSDIGPHLLSVQNLHPTIARRYDLGATVEGRSLWAIKISDNVDLQEDEPEFRYISTMHGNEILGMQMCLYLIDYLTDNYGTDTRATDIVNEVELWIVPLMNPDGYDRPTRTRYNADGVDLNRDFPDLGDPNTTIGRAPETAAIMNWSMAHSFVASANFHGGALVVSYPFDNYDSGSNLTPDDDLFVWMSEEYSQYNLPMWSGYWYHGITNGADWYVIHGSMEDWAYHFTGCNEVTIEVSNVKEPLALKLPTFWIDNRDSMLAYLETCLVGVRGLVTDASTGLPLAATITLVGRNYDVYTDPDVGDYHRMVMPGTYDLLVEAAGHDSRFKSDVVVDSGDATRLDVVLGPPTQVAAPNGGESLPGGAATTITWTGSTTARFQVQYTDDADGHVPSVDDFESGTLDPVFTTGGQAVWFVATDSSHGGLRSARAGGISDNEVSWMARATVGTDVSFWYRVSSEQNFDFFNFYVDGERMIHASGAGGAWTFYSATLAPDANTLKWEYTKDGTVSSGSDTVWIDDLQINENTPTWTDVVALTDHGATSTPWTPLAGGVNYKVRVRAYYGVGDLGLWDESDAPFAVVSSPADGDYDQDGSVDMRDFILFQGCFGNGASPACLDAFDFIADDVLDLNDYAGFAQVLLGPG